ncbi:unnamed protein product [Rotaria sp. Silwood1]|nr:unnamed protein product [Rotaria sp. Silwood1]
MPLCEKMDGQALVQLYKMCAAQRNETYVLLNNELQSTKEIKLPIGVYVRFLSIMERISTFVPIEFPVLPPIEEYPIYPSIPYLNQPCDIVITSNASPLQILQMLHNFVPSIKSKSYSKELI